MNWGQMEQNHSEHRLTGSELNWGMIQRDHSARKAQIKHVGLNVWCDLIDFRYGMSSRDRQEDINATGISDAVHQAQVRALAAKEYAGCRNRSMKSRIYVGTLSVGKRAKVSKSFPKK